MLNDAPRADSTESLFETVVEQVTRLCQRLMQIPMTLSINGNNLKMKTRTKSPAYLDESENTDSDSSEKETNGSNLHTRPRENSDSRAGLFYTNRSSASRKSPGVDTWKLKRAQNDIAYQKLLGIHNEMYQNKLYMDRFEAIGNIPNDSESSDGSFRGNSPGPLRGYPLSVQRRPSSAGRAERHLHTRDRSSSLPLINARRCHTPTPSSKGTLIAVNGMGMSDRHKSLNGVAFGSAMTDTFSRKERCSSDSHRMSPLGRQLALKDRPFTRKTSQNHLSKDEILTSYERNVENLVKRQIKAHTNTQDNHSSSEGSDSTKSEHNQTLAKVPFRNTEEQLTDRPDESLHAKANRMESETKELFVGGERKSRYKGDIALDINHQRLTPKRLLPKVPSTQIQNLHRDPESRRDRSSNSQHLAENFVKPSTVQNALRSDREESKKEFNTQRTIDAKITQQDKLNLYDLHDDPVAASITIKSGKAEKDRRETDQQQIKSHGEEEDMQKKESNLPTTYDKTSSNINKERETNVTKSDIHGFDIDEIRFKENVRTARREIIDKLRSKYALPRHEHDPTEDKTTTESEFKSNMGLRTDAQTDRDTHQITTKSNVETQLKTSKESESPKSVLKPEHISKNMLSGSMTERHSPVMSIAGLKRYKSTTNLSKLESFDNATSKFDGSFNKTASTYDRNEKTKNKSEQAENESQLNNSSGKSDDNSDQSSESNDTKAFAMIDKLSRSLTDERKSLVLSLIPLDRQGLLRSASVENVDSYQFINSLGSGASAETVSNKLKESGISTMSFNDISLDNAETLNEKHMGETFGSEEPRDGVRMPTSSSDNGFDSSEGLENSEDSLDDLNNDQGDNNICVGKPPTLSPKLYPAKLIVIDNHKTTSSKEQEESTTATELHEIKPAITKLPESKWKPHETLTQSNVRSAVDKLENATFSRSRPEKRTLKQFMENSMDRTIHVRSRSASASRNPASAKGDFVPQSARAIYPRGRFGSAGETSEVKSPLPSLFSSIKKSRSIEADLNKICREETAESIRREWIQRRSASVTTPKRATPKLPTPETTRSIFKFDKSYYLPSRYLRSRISGIVSLQNGRFVILDELQMCLFLLTSDFRIAYETPMENMPCGICITGSNSFAIAFPYKSIIRVFYIVKDRVTHTRDIVNNCTEWITDIKHRKGRIHVLCKAGHIHILGITGREEGKVDAGMTGKLQLNEAGNRFYIHGERKLTRFNDKGDVIWTKSDINASCLMLYNDKLYIADSDTKRIITLSEIGDTRDLLSSDTGPLSAVCFSHNADTLYTCQYSEDMDDESTRRISVYKKTH